MPALAFAQTGRVEVRATGSEQLSSAPRQVVSTTFTVRNGSPQPLLVEATIVLPPGWQLVTPEQPFELGAGEASMRLLSFMIPESARAGDYTVSYEARDRLQRMAGDRYSVQVRVTPSLRIQVVALDAPDFVIGGDRYRSAFVIRNLGNTPATVAFKARGRRGSRVEPEEGTLDLAAGEAKQIEVEATAPTAHQRFASRVTVTAEAVGLTQAANAVSLTQVVPRASALDAYKTLGSRLGLNLVARDARGHRTSGWQPELSGAGLIDEENKRYLSFRLRGPDARDSGSLGASDEFWVRYESDQVTAVLGDFTYGLSRLTEPGRYGRGALVGYKNDTWGISAYGMRDPYSGTAGEQGGVNAFYRITPSTQVDLNTLHKNDASAPADIVSLRTQTEWDAGFSTDLELGESRDQSMNNSGEARQSGRAVRAALYDNRHALRYYFLGWAAEPGFNGYLRDKEYLSAGFDYPRSIGWGLRGYYRLQNWNLQPLEELDPDLLDRTNPSDLMRAGPTERQASLGTDHALGRDARFTLDYTLRMRESGDAESPIDIETRAWRAGLAKSWRNLSLHYAFERGTSQNEVTDSEFATSMHLVSASLRVGRAQSYGLYAMRDLSTYSDEPESARTSFGFNASYSLGLSTSLSLDAQRNRTPLSTYQTYNLSFVHEREDGGRFRVAARRLAGRFARTDFLASYSMPFTLPVARKSGVSALRGRVFDQETGGGLKDILLRLEGLTAVTNARGEFEFPAVKAGQYQMVMDRARLDIEKVPAAGASSEVTIGDRASAPMQIAVVRAAAITVNVKLHPDDGQAARPAPNVLVILTSGTVTLRRLTDSLGSVQLGGLAPGTWVITVSEETVPQGYARVARELEIDAAPGESVVAEVPLSPVRRSIRMLPPLAVR